MVIYMYIAKGQGQMNPWGQFYSEPYCPFAHFLEVFPFNDMLTVYCLHDLSWP